MDSGHICDDCQRQLDNPPQNGVSKTLSADEREALRVMRTFVSGDFPHAIVMKGGGVKGLALAGALVEIEKYFWFDRHVGTSAGAIAAILLAANYSPNDLVEILRVKNFREFKDASLWKLPFNLLVKRGLYPGEHFREWIAALLRRKSGKVGETYMKDLNGAIIYACRRGPGTLVFESEGEHSDTVAAFAARCSMSIPLFFFPERVDGRRVYDGGMKNNFPLSKFLSNHPGKPFIALYLGKGDDKNKRSLGSELLDIWIDGEEHTVVDANRSSVVVIDTSPVGTVDFRLQELEKNFLLKVGQAAALKFLLDRKLDDGPDEVTVANTQREAEELRAAVVRMRSKRKLCRILMFLPLLIVFILIVPKLWVLALRFLHR